MSNDAKFVAGSIEEILVSLARGISDAQEQLNRFEPFDAYGRPRPQYHLPYLDFALKVNIQSSTTVAAEPTTRLARIAAGGEPPLLAAPLPKFSVAFPKPAQSGSVSSEITSTLSGRFISIPPNDGMPQISLSATISKTGATLFELNVIAGRSDGQPVVGGQVEFNIDEPLTLAANPGLAASIPAGSALLSAGLVQTDGSGAASSSVDLASLTDPKLKKLFIRVQLGLLSTSIMIDRSA